MEQPNVEDRLQRRVRAEIKRSSVQCEDLDKWEVMLVTLTPGMAREWMTRDYKGNRSIRQKAVDEYARDMDAGNWDIPTDAIAFNDQGDLLNGRHRLLATIKSGHTSTSIILLGKNTMIDIDGGIPRSTGDFFHLMGVGNSRETAAITRYVADWEVNRLASRLNLKWSTNELWSVWERHPRIANSMSFVSKFPKAKLGQIGRKSILSAFHYLFALEDEALADAYVDAIVTGEHIGANDAASAVRDKFVNIQIESSRRRVGNRDWSHYLAKGWRATCEGKTFKRLLITRSEKFPLIGPEQEPSPDDEAKE